MRVRREDHGSRCESGKVRRSEGKRGSIIMSYLHNVTHTLFYLTSIYKGDGIYKGEMKESEATALQASHNISTHHPV